MAEVADQAAAEAAAADALGSAAPTGSPAAAPAPGAAAPAGSAPVVADESQLWIGATLHWGRVARAAMQEKHATHWTDDRLAAVGEALAGSAKFHGWKWGAILDHPDLKLAAAVVSLAWPFIEPHVMPHLEKITGGMVKAAPPPAPEDKPAAAAAADAAAGDGGSAPPKPTKVAPIE